MSRPESVLELRRDPQNFPVTARRTSVRDVHAAIVADGDARGLSEGRGDRRARAAGRHANQRTGPPKNTGAVAYCSTYSRLRREREIGDRLESARVNHWRLSRRTR